MLWSCSARLPGSRHLHDYAHYGASLFFLLAEQAQAPQEEEAQPAPAVSTGLAAGSCGG